MVETQHRRNAAIFLGILMLMLSLSTVNLQPEIESLDDQTVESSPTAQSSHSISGGHEGSIFSGVSLSAAGSNACAILDTHEVKCWGSAYLGGGNTTSSYVPITGPTFDSNKYPLSISGGRFHFCVLVNDGSVMCWGRGIDGQIGHNSTDGEYSPTKTENFTSNMLAVALSSGNFHSCAILEDGSVSCWGKGSFGQLGDGANTNRLSPVQTSSFVDNRKAIAVSAGGEHTCAILDNGSVSCWGLNDYGQLGVGDTTNRNTPANPVNLGEGRTAVAISSGVQHTCVILDNGKVVCWGRNSHRQVGGTTSGVQIMSPNNLADIGTGEVATSIASGDNHTCASLQSGVVKCWGSGYNGQIGDGGSGHSGIRTYPTATSSLGTGRSAIFVTTNEKYSCAGLDNGSVSCWGYGWSGRLGYGGNSDKTTPTQTASLGGNLAAYELDKNNNSILDVFEVSEHSQSGVISTDFGISSGGEHTCAIMENGTVRCWGDNYQGQLGDGTTVDKTIPTYTSSLGQGRSAKVISLGQRHTCVILDNDDVKCWGDNYRGQLGDGSGSDQTSPTSVSSFGSNKYAIAISSGGYHTCAIIDNGSVMCWGWGLYGQLGNGGTSNSNIPVLVSSLGQGRTAIAIASGTYHTCAILDDGSVKCWGRGNSGQLGNGGTASATMPTSTSSLGLGKTAVAISAGSSHTCALLNDGAVKCWGDNSYGQIGDGGTTAKLSPTSTSGFGQGVSAMALSTGGAASCVIVDNYSLMCWGRGAYGQMGNGATTDQTSPVSTSSLGTDRYSIGISVGGLHACSILDNGSVSCWGAGIDGRLGNGATTQQNSPSSVSNTWEGNLTLAAINDDDRDLTANHLDSDPNNPVYSISCNSGTYGRYDCTDSPSGNFVSQSSQFYYVACSVGTYQPQTGQTACINASTGHYVEDIAAINQTECSIGTYQASTGQTSCDDASAGYFVNQTGQSSQTPCPVGTFQPSEGQTSCWITSKGYYNNQTGSPNRIPCALGTYQPLSGQTYCIDASPGHYVSLTGWSKQFECLPGKYQPLAKQSSCNSASAGYYVSSRAQTNQTACPIGQYQSYTGQAYCNNASVGHYVLNQTAQTNQIACQLGTYQPLQAQLSCHDADIGYFVNTTGQMNQVACSIGTYQPLTAQSSCTNASVGHYVSQTGQSSMTPCSVGTYQALEGQSSCDDASIGHYVAQSGQASQIPCSAGTYQGLTGMSSCTDALAGHFVPQPGSSQQQACSVGSYQALTGQSSCDNASAGYYVPITGQSTQIACAQGTYQALTGQAACNNASIGYYVALTGQISEQACSLGTYQPLAGQASCIDASPGYYVGQLASNSQEMCSIGYYQPSAGQSSCIIASAGNYVDLVGQSSQVACQIGTYQPLTGQSSCIETDPGYFTGQTGQASQDQCAIGTYQPKFAQSSCIDASAGYYVSQMGQTGQSACIIGTYQSSTGQSSCLDSQPGYFVSGTGSTVQYACNLGTYQANSASSSCDIADYGYYVSSIASASQTACPQGTWTITNHTVSIDLCLADTDGDHLVDILDSDADGNGIDDVIDAQNAFQEALANASAAHNETLEELSQVSDELNQTTANLQSMYAAFNESQNDLNDAESDIGTLESELTSVNSELNQTNDDLANTQASLATAEEEISNLENELSSTNSDVVSINSELDQIKNSLAALNSNLTSTQAELTIALAEVQSLEDDLLENEDELSEQDAELTMRESELKSSMDELSSSKTINMGLIGVIVVLLGALLYTRGLAKGSQPIQASEKTSVEIKEVEAEEEN